MQDPERVIDGTISAEVLASIAGRELLTNHLGAWPTFHDYEVISIILDRAPWPRTATSDIGRSYLSHRASAAL